MDLIKTFRKKQEKEYEQKKLEIKEKIAINSLLSANIAERVLGGELTKPQAIFPSLYEEEIQQDLAWQLEIQKQKMIEYAEWNNKKRREQDG